MKKSRDTGPAPTDSRRQTPGVGRTERAREGAVEPRLPHERDESADSQNDEGPGSREASAERIGEQAFEDLRAGRQDTGRLPVTGQVYEELKKPGTAKDRKQVS